jgi:hypothetical protein
MDDRRQFPRIPAAAPVFGRVRSLLPARIVDFSQGGLQLELTSSLRPGTVCEVTVPTNVGPIQAKASVRRCRGKSVRTEDGTRLFYYAGLQFESLGEPEQRALASGLDVSLPTTLELSGVDAGFRRVG